MEFSSRVFSCDFLFPGRNIVVPTGKIYQVSELSLIRGGEISDHIQYCDEITYAVSGSAKFYSDDVCSDVSRGQIHYIKKGIKHKIISDDKENFRYICIGFMPNFDNEKNLPYLGIRNQEDYFVKNDDGNIKRLTELFLNEFYLEDESNETMLDMYFSQILISLSRIYHGNISYMNKKNSSTSNYAVYHALRYIDREYMYITSVKNVAKKLSYSEYYISHAFSEKIGMSIKEYITRKKLQSAAQMLKTTEMSVSEISDYLNFGTQHTFRQAFKRIYGMSPVEYRKS